MKRILISLIFIPFMAFANTSDLGVHATSWDIDGAGSIDGYGIDYTGLAGDNNILTDVTYDKVSGPNGFSSTYSIISASYAFGDATEGAFDLGFTRLDSDGSDTEVKVGYGRRGGEGLDYHIGLLDGDDGTTVTFKIRGESGVTFSLLSDDGDRIMSLGYSWRLGQ